MLLMEEVSGGLSTELGGREGTGSEGGVPTRKYLQEELYLYLYMVL